MNTQAFDIALETSTRKASLAICHAASTSVEFLADDVAHASDLLPLLTQSLERRGLQREQMRSVHVGLGPGSFTGLRVGCAIALGLAQGFQIPLCGLPSVAVTAWCNLAPGERGTVVLDARGGALYLATYLRQKEGLVTERPPTRLKIADAQALQLPEGFLLGEEKALTILHGEERSPHPWRPDAQPDAGGLLYLGLQQLESEGPTDPGDVRPMYMADFGA